MRPADDALPTAALPRTPPPAGRHGRAAVLVALLVLAACCTMLAPLAGAQSSPDEVSGGDGTDPSLSLPEPPPTDTPVAASTQISVPTSLPTSTPTPLPAALATAVANTAGAGAAAATATTFQGAIQSPVSGATLPANQAFPLTGWVVDTSAQGWAGVDTVEVFAEPLGAGVFDLGPALRALPRPDIGQQLSNPYWSASGFSFTVPGLPPGVYLISVQAHAPNGTTWSTQVLVGVAAPAGEPDPSIPRYTHDGYQVAASAELWPALDLLRSQNDAWVMEAFSAHKTAVVVSSGLPNGQYGVFARPQNVVVLDPSLLAGDNTATAAAMLVHMGAYVRDAQADQLGTPEQCISSARSAVKESADLWYALFGVAGRNPPVHPYDVVMNGYDVYHQTANSLLDALIAQTAPTSCDGLIY